MAHFTSADTYRMPGSPQAHKIPMGGKWLHGFIDLYGKLPDEMIKNKAKEERMINRRQALTTLASATLAGGISRSTIAFAETYPTKPVRIIVPFAPGGSVDTVARLLADKLSRKLGQNFIVENIAGATGNIGTGQAARATPDGYTVLLAFSSHIINPLLFAAVPYDASKDFTPVTQMVSATHVIVVHPSLPANSLNELVDLVKKNPGKYGYAHGGAGTPGHLLGEQFRLTTGVDLVAVPFNGAGPAVNSVLGGHTPIGFIALSPAAPHVLDGKLRALGVTSKSRSPLLLTVPTSTEAGFPAILGDLWVGAFLPSRTPSNIGNLLYREIKDILASDDIKGKLAALGFMPVGSTPVEFAEELKNEENRWADLIKRANIKLQ
jgi:tripartite-type tricarboxylate transporter receptor subunit TctC